MGLPTEVAESGHLIAETDNSRIELILWGGTAAVFKKARKRTERTTLTWRNEIKALAVVGGHMNTSLLLHSNLDDLSLVLRLERGRSLDLCVERDSLLCTLARSDADSVLAQMAGALAFVHAQSMIHDDVKPGNIMWDADRARAVLMDFGAAIHHHDGGDVVFNPSGDPPYAPPEFLARSKGPEGDVWGLGVAMLFAIRCIKLPDGEWILPHVFEQGDAFREMTKWLADIDGVRERLTATEPTLAMMLARDPNRRITSRDLAQQLGQ